MKKVVSFGILFVLLAASVSAFAEIKQVHLNVDDGLLYGHVSIDRNSEDDLRMLVFIPDLDVWYRKGPLDNDENPLNVDFITDIPTEPGFYLARVTVRNDEGHTSVYRPVWIE